MRKQIAIGAAAMLAATVLAGCSGGSAQPAASDDPTAPLLVWVDAERQPVVQKFIEEKFTSSHPGIEVKVELVDATQGTNTAKIALAQKAGEGVPDIVFIGSPDEIASLSANPINYPLALNGLVEQSVLDDFPSAKRCSYGDQIYCLGNDTGQTVFWYNKALFDEWGYSAPATFSEFKELGVKLAQEHAGYNLGTVNGRYGTDAWLGSSGCPFIDVVDPVQVRINLADPKCSRVIDVMAPLLENGALANLDLFDKNYTAQVADGKVVGMIGASWVADFAFKPMFKDANKEAEGSGKYAAAPMPTWDGESTNWSGAVGGGIWVASASTKNKQATVDFLVGITTDIDIAKAQATYPAYIPGAQAWLADKAADTWYAENPSEVLLDAANKVNPADGYVRYQTELLESFNATVIKGNASADSLAQFGEQAKAAAEATGYTVVS
ncbi:MAG: extracellular solute-binding protein [Propionibacteriaceae bacterium]|nr:extracellular solute-binding protein [Propionibacteriaceae bacterium]